MMESCRLTNIAYSFDWRDPGSSVPG